MQCRHQKHIEMRRAVVVVKDGGDSARWAHRGIIGRGNGVFASVTRDKIKRLKRNAMKCLQDFRRGHDEMIV